MDQLIYRSTRMAELLERALRLAATDEPILICGETGTGKEVLARWIHLQSPRRLHPFVPVDCPGIPPNLLHSVLFGHVRGAFTGASAERRGLLRAATKGTILLDEVCDLPMDVQTALLRAVDRREVYTVGDDAPFVVEARILSATSQDAERRVSLGTFRHDLLFRLGACVLEIPPLRDRGDDVLLIAERFLDECRPGSGGARRTIGAAAARALLSYDFPGNVRELGGIIRQAAFECRTEDLCDIAEMIDQRRRRTAQGARSARSTADPRALERRDDGDELRDHLLTEIRRGARPSIARLARAFDRSEKTVRRRIHDLVNEGAVVLRGRGRGAYLEPSSGIE